MPIPMSDGWRYREVPSAPQKSPSKATGFALMGQIWFAYIIQSQTDASYYVGHTHDLELRVLHHNDGWTISSKAGRPWRLVYAEMCGSKGEAMKREKHIKRMKSKVFIERLI